MFADWELIGIPHRWSLSDRGLKAKAGRVPGPARRQATGWRWPTWSPWPKGLPMMQRGAWRCWWLLASWPATLPGAGGARKEEPLDGCGAHGAGGDRQQRAAQAPFDTIETGCLPALAGAMSQRLKRRKEPSTSRASSSSRRCGTSRRAEWTPGAGARAGQVESGFRKRASVAARAATCR